jgi:hypothetical protein
MNGNPNTVRLATLDELLLKTIPQHIAPTPTRRQLCNWLDEAKIPRFKSNPAAKRGGGVCYYSVAAVEKFLRTRLLPGRIQTEVSA